MKCMIVSGQCDDSDKCFCQCKQHLNDDMDVPIPPGFLWSPFMDPPSSELSVCLIQAAPGYDVCPHCCLC